MDIPALNDVQRAVAARYEVLDLAGTGGMGAVYRARHRELGHLVAIKVLPPEVAESANRAARFKREAALAAALSHPHIVPVYEFEAHPELSFLIMPFVQGRTLEAILDERKRLPLGRGAGRWRAPGGGRSRAAPAPWPPPWSRRWRPGPPPALPPPARGWRSWTARGAAAGGEPSSCPPSSPSSWWA